MQPAGDEFVMTIKLGVRYDSFLKNRDTGTRSKVTVMEGPKPVTEDSRGIIGPEALRRHTRLDRYPAGTALEGLIAWFWVASWSLPANTVHTQELLTHPAPTSTSVPKNRTASRRPNWKAFCSNVPAAAWPAPGSASPQ